MAIGRLNNLYQLWGILVLAGLGIGGIVVPASIITTIICPDVSFPRAIDHAWLELYMTDITKGPNCHHFRAHVVHPCRGWRHRLLHLLQCVHLQMGPTDGVLRWWHNGERARHHGCQADHRGN